MNKGNWPSLTQEPRASAISARSSAARWIDYWNPDSLLRHYPARIRYQISVLCGIRLGILHHVGAAVFGEDQANSIGAGENWSQVVFGVLAVGFEDGLLFVTLFEDVGPDLDPAVEGAALEGAALGDGNHGRNLGDVFRDGEHVVQNVDYVLKGVGEGIADACLDSMSPGRYHILPQYGRVAHGERNFEIYVSDVLVGGKFLPVEDMLLDGGKDEAVVYELLLGRCCGCAESDEASCQQGDIKYAFHNRYKYPLQRRQTYWLRRAKGDQATSEGKCFRLKT